VPFPKARVIRDSFLREEKRLRSSRLRYERPIPNSVLLCFRHHLQPVPRTESILSSSMCAPGPSATPQIPLRAARRARSFDEEREPADVSEGCGRHIDTQQLDGGGTKTGSLSASRY